MSNIVGMQVRSVEVEVRSMFKRMWNKFYHRAYVCVNGQKVCKFNLTSDGLSTYIYDVFHWLRQNGYVKKEGDESPWECAERLGISLDCKIKRVYNKARL